MELIIIAAVSSNGIIGDNKRIPWFDADGKSRVRSDMLRFKLLTLGKTVIMGRTTYEAMGRALSGRQNIVLSRDPSFTVSDANTARSIDAALGLVTKREAFVIGGGQIFSEFLPYAHRMELTIIEEHCNGTVFFPSFSLYDWRIAALEHYDRNPTRGDHFPFRYETWIRNSLAFSQ